MPKQSAASAAENTNQEAATNAATENTNSEPVAQESPTPTPTRPTPQSPTRHEAYFAGDPAAHATRAENEEQEAESNEAEEQAETPTEKTFTQEEVNKMIGQTRKEVREQFKDYDDLKAKAQEAEQTTKSKEEQEAARLQEVERKANELAAKNAQLLLEMSLKDAAADIGLPSDAAFRLVDLDSVEYDDAGRVTNAETLVADVAKKYPGLVKRAASAPVVNPAREPQEPRRTDADRRRSLLGQGGGSFFESGTLTVPNE